MGPESFGSCPQEEPLEESWGGVLAGTLGGEESQEKSWGGGLGRSLRGKIMEKLWEEPQEETSGWMERMRGRAT